MRMLKEKSSGDEEDATRNDRRLDSRDVQRHILNLISQRYNLIAWEPHNSYSTNLISISFPIKTVSLLEVNSF